jgi:hypothetical protein
MFWFVGSSRLTPQIAVDCTVLPYEEKGGTLNTEQLLYLHDGSVQFFHEISSTDGSFNANVVNTIFTTRISPDGLWVTSLELDEERQIQVVTRDVRRGAEIFSTHPEDQRITDFAWLSNTEYLTIVGYPRFQFYAYSIINPFTGDIRFVHPVDPYLTQQFGTNSDPLFPGEMPGLAHNISPDGHYLITAGTNNRIFEFASREFLVLENLRDGIWSYTSDRMISIDIVGNGMLGFEETGELSVYIYDVSEDAVENVASVLRSPGEFIYITPYSWSPNEESVALTHNFYSEPYSYSADILNLTTNEVLDLCIVGTGEWQHNFDFFWSRDSRYLALYGQLVGEERETGSVYIYDTQTGDIYEVYRGSADIVGWMSNPD